MGAAGGGVGEGGSATQPQLSPPGPADALDYSLRSQSDLDDQHDYDSVASDEDTDQELLRNASRNNRARVGRSPLPTTQTSPPSPPRSWC